MTCVRFWARRRCYVLTVVMNVELGWAKPNWMWNLLAWWSPFVPQSWMKNSFRSSSLHNLIRFLQLFLQRPRVSSYKLQPTSKDVPKCSLHVKLGRESDEELPWWFWKRKVLRKDRKWFLTKAYWDTGGMKLLIFLLQPIPMPPN